MAENENDQLPNDNDQQKLDNEFKTTPDGTVVVDEKDRTVILTADETTVIEKSPDLFPTPANRPRKVYSGMWGTPEMAVVGASLFLLLLTFGAYWYFVSPIKSELEKTRAENQKLEKDLTAAKNKFGNMESVETEVAKLVTSVNDFEANYLPVAETGRTSLYQRLNSLITGYGLINTNGPTYAPLEIVDINKGVQNDDERGRDRFRSFFPGLYITTTVEGPYQNLRRFLRDIETGREFIVISSVQLEPSESGSEKEDQPPVNSQTVQNDGSYIDPTTGIRVSADGRPAQPTRRVNKAVRGEVVSLRIEMAAYFRRPMAFTPEPEEGGAQQ